MEQHWTCKLLSALHYLRRFLPRLHPVFFMLALAMMLGPVPGPSYAQQNLPLEVQTDLAMLKFERAMTSKDPASILAAIDEVRALSPALAAGDMLFFEAETAIAMSDPDRAEAALNQFVSTVGRGSDLYPLALELFLDLPRARKEAAAKAQAEAQAELARQQEIERRERERERRVREQRVQASRQAALARERQAVSSLETLRDIRFILHSSFSSLSLPQPRPKGLDDPFTETEREWISLYLKNPHFRYLDQHSTSSILRRGFSPRVPNFKSYSDFDRGNWSAWKEESGRCHARTIAMAPRGDGSLFQIPTLGVSFHPDWDRSWIGLPLLSPNNFRVDFPITLMVDNRAFELELHQDGVNIVPKGDWSAVTRAMQAGQRIRVKGMDQYTLKPMEIEFSAVGFTSALRHIASQCDRTDELSRWIEL